MTNMNSNFQTWLTTQYTQQASDYRMRLNWVLQTCKSYEGEWKPEHVQIGIDCLAMVAVPGSVGKYPGEVSQEDRAWYKTCVKPSWDDIRKEFEDEICKLSDSVTVA